MCKKSEREGAIKEVRESGEGAGGGGEGVEEEGGRELSVLTSAILLGRLEQERGEAEGGGKYMDTGTETRVRLIDRISHEHIDQSLVERASVLKKPQSGKRRFGRFADLGEPNPLLPLLLLLLLLTTSFVLQIPSSLQRSRVRLLRNAEIVPDGSLPDLCATGWRYAAPPELACAGLADGLVPVREDVLGPEAGEGGGGGGVGGLGGAGFGGAFFVWKSHEDERRELASGCSGFCGW